MKEEEWKFIEDTNNKYSISNYGRVKDHFTCKNSPEYSPYRVLGGRYYVSYKKNKKSYNAGVHTLVAKYFIPNPNNYLFVIHKDGNKLNNYFENLEWTGKNNFKEDQLKVCKTCGIEKPLKNFTKTSEGRYGVSIDCKDCQKIKRDYLKTIPKYRELRRKWNKISYDKRSKDIKYRITSALRASLNINCSKRNVHRRSRFFNDIVGIDISELIKYLESKFTPEMNWNNHGTYWHIDHIIPLSSAKTVFEVYALCHYSNLQPLEAIENLKKGKKLPENYKVNNN